MNVFDVPNASVGKGVRSSSYSLKQGIAQIRVKNGLKASKRSCDDFIIQ